jgi:hypothetical protein
MKSPAVIITEELGKNPQEEMIGLEKKAKKGVKKKVGKRELRHRVKQTPFRKILRAVEDKAAEGGSVVFYVSSFRNSRVCPIHFALLKNGGGWHALHCPRGHAVDRDAAAVLNMLWRATPTGWVKGVWWDVKEAKKRLKKGIMPKDAAKKRNPLVPWPVVCAVWTSLMALKASSQWPAVLARAAPMTPARGADEDGTRAPPRPKGTPPFRARRRSVRYPRPLKERGVCVERPRCVYPHLMRQPLFVERNRVEGRPPDVRHNEDASIRSEPRRDGPLHRHGVVWVDVFVYRYRYL